MTYRIPLFSLAHESAADQIIWSAALCWMTGEGFLRNGSEGKIGWKTWF